MIGVALVLSILLNMGLVFKVMGLLEDNYALQEELDMIEELK